MFNKDKLQELKNDIYILQTKCEIYSMYEKEMIAQILTSLISSYEGTKHIYKFLYDENNNEKCVITEENRKNNSNTFIIPIIKPIHNSNNYKYDKNDYFFLPPSYYSDDSKLKIKYIQEFIDSVFEKRFNNNQTLIDRETLNTYLTEYLSKTKLQKFLHQNERMHNNEIKKQNDRIREFKMSCKVSRVPFFNAIVSILNDYEESNIRAFTTGEEISKYDEKTDTISFQYYECLRVMRIQKDYKYETLVAEDTVPYDEQELKTLDYKADTDINYFEVKQELETIQWDCTNLKKFFNKIEIKLKKKLTLDEDDINDAYLEVVNSCKKLVR